MKNRIILVVGVALAALAIAGIYLYTQRAGNTFDERLQTALQGVQELHSYEMLDETHATVSDRTIEIYGLYTLDFDAQRFAANSTTTLYVPKERPPKNKHIFTLGHRAIGDDVYVRIQTKSDLLKKTIPYGDAWRHFKANDIPSRFVDIAVPGAILNNLAILGENGAYLSLIGEPIDYAVGSSTYHVYSFKLSKKAVDVPAGQLRSLLDLIATGTVDVLVDDTPAVRMLRFFGPGYTSTTTLLSLNTPVDVTAPAVSE